MFRCTLRATRSLSAKSNVVVPCGSCVCEYFVFFCFHSFCFIEIRYWHICAVTRVPGFSAAVSVIGLQEVDAVEIVKLFVGHGIQVREREME